MSAIEKITYKKWKNIFVTVFLDILGNLVNKEAVIDLFNEFASINFVDLPPNNVSELSELLLTGCACNMYFLRLYTRFDVNPIGFTSQLIFQV